MPTDGPQVLSIPGFNGVPVGDGVTITVDFQWPFSCFVTGILLVPTFATPDVIPDPTTMLPNLRLAIEDTLRGRAIVSDGGAGTALIAGAPNFAPVLALQGKAWKPFPVQKPVVVTDTIWRIRLLNKVVGAPVGVINIGALLVFFEEP